MSPKPMRDALRAVESSFDGVEAVPEEQSLRGAVLTFIRTTQQPGFRDLKYACFGATLPFNGDKERLVDRPETFQRLLAEVDDQQREVRRFRRCYQALLQSYFAYQSKDEQSPSAANEPAFRTLRAFLTDRLELVVRPVAGRSPAWSLVLKEHANLLTDRPCGRYTAQLADGRTDELASVCAGLGINRQSWVWQEVVLAYLRQICERTDRDFKSVVGNALDLAEGKSAIHPSAATARAVAAQLVRRYSECADHPEHPRLRDACVLQIGNPWVRRSAWDAWVRHEPARQLVDSWLKSKIMEDFFMLLSDHGGGAVDKRRLKYWLKFVGVIDDMWFMLGSDAYRSPTVEYKQMRSRMAGRLKGMTGGTPQNNAFAMRIGEYVFIEFGSTGNACYVYEAASAPHEEGSHSVSLSKLKRGSDRMAHRGSWELDFDRELRRLLGTSLVPTIGAGSGSRRTDSAAGAGGPGQSDATTPPSTRNRGPSDSVVARIDRSTAQSLGDTSPASIGAGTLSSKGPALDPATKQVQPAVEADRLDEGLSKVLHLCEKAGFGYEVFRANPPLVWVSSAASFSSPIRSELRRNGFKDQTHLGSNGYWLGGDDASPAAEPKNIEHPRESWKRPGHRGGSDSELAEALKLCEALKIPHQDFANDGAGMWVHADARRNPQLFEHLKRLGFKTHSSGLWLGSLPKRADFSSKHVINSAKLKLLLDRCDAWKISHRDLRSQGGNLWIYADPDYHPALCVELEALGFAHAKDRGYWLARE